MLGKVRIRRFAVIRTANVFALMYVVLIAVIAIPIILFLIPASMTTTAGDGSTATTILVGGIVIALLVMLIYGIFAWIFGAIFALLYNFAARWVGGIEVDVERFGNAPSAFAQGYPAAYPPGYGPPPGWTPPPSSPQSPTPPPSAPLSPTAAPPGPSTAAPPDRPPEDRQPAQ